VVVVLQFKYICRVVIVVVVVAAPVVQKTRRYGYFGYEESLYDQIYSTYLICSIKLGGTNNFYPYN